MSKHFRNVVLVFWLYVLNSAAHAFFFIIPIPNLAKPASLGKVIDALEKSEETKAVAYASEDKTFGSKQWVWGIYSGHVPQAEADRIAMARCQTSLANSKAQSAGGKPLYDFGTKSCELHNFSNKTVSARANEWNPGPVTAKPEPTTSSPNPNVGTNSTEGAGTTDSNSKPANEDGARTPAVSTTVALQPPEASQATKKLRELEQLRKEGLISELEYQEKRKAVLSNL